MLFQGSTAGVIFDSFLNKEPTAPVRLNPGLPAELERIIGKALDQPVYNLLGGMVHEKIRAYTYIYPASDDSTSDRKNGDHWAIADAFGDAEITPRRAADYAAQGFTAVKFDPVMPMGAFDPRQLSVEVLDNAELVVKNVREAVGVTSGTPRRSS